MPALVILIIHLILTPLSVGKRLINYNWESVFLDAYSCFSTVAFSLCLWVFQVFLGKIL